LNGSKIELTPMALLQQHLQHARQHMKLVADKKRTDRVFAVGDWVFLKMQPCVQKSLATCANPKLAFRYFGPFQVLQCVGDTSYKLQLPNGCLIHPVIHVLQLHQGVLLLTPVLTDLPASSTSPPEPVKVLETWLYKHGGGTCSQVRVQWRDQPEALATWEDQHKLVHRFPDAAAWGQAGSQPGENVMDGATTSATHGPEAGTGDIELLQCRSLRERRPNPWYL
jgi:hypothetical protein